MTKFYNHVQYKNCSKNHALTFVWEPYFQKIKGKVLDAGCSVGTFAQVAPNQIIGIDNDKEALEICKNKNLKVKFADLEKKIPFKDNFFEGVFCSHTIEHLNNPLNMMKEIYRVLKPRGILVLITPDYIKSHDKGFGFWADYTHKTPFTKESLKRIAFDSDFKQYEINHRIKQFKIMTFAVKVLGLENVQSVLNGYDLILTAKKGD